MPATQSIQALVIGAGPGGYSCAIRLGQLGIKTVLVEAGELGGVCLNVGCIPSKALITAAKHLDQAKHGAHMGIEVQGAQANLPKLQEWKSGIVKKLTSGVGTLCKGNGVEVVRGAATFLSAKRVQVGDTVYEAQHIVIATGSEAIEIPGFAFDEKTVLSATGALSLNELPRELVIIGGGYIGLELGGVYNKLGSHVTVVEATDQLLPGQDPELVQVVARKLKSQGVQVILKAKAKAFKAGKVEIEAADGTQTLTADKVLVTVGRRPRTKGFGLENTGVQVDAKGFIKVDRQLRTSVPGIYAIGDVAGQPMLAHKAYKDADVCAEVIAGKNVVLDVKAIPAVIFTDPEIATTGLSEVQAKEQGHQVRVGKFPFAALGRAMTTDATDGFVKLVIDRDSKEILGVGIVGPEASELVAEATLSIEMGAFAEDIALTIHAHPTLAEGFHESAKVALGEAIHALNR